LTVRQQWPPALNPEPNSVLTSTTTPPLPPPLQLVDAFVEEVFEAGSTIIQEGDPGDKFYVIKG
jgi:hypothetical protein